MLSASQYPLVRFDNLITDLKNGVEIRTYAEDGYRYLRVSDLGQHGIENHNRRYVDVEEIPEKIKLTDNSFLVSRSGSLGLVSVVGNELRDAILSSHIFKIDLDTNQVRPKYLEAVLRSQIGQVQFFRNNNGAVIPEISQSALKSILVVLPPPGIQNHIVTIMQSAYAQKARKEQEADALLKSIDGYVLAELGIEMPTVEEKRSFVVHAGQLVGRIDPGYNHPKYAAIEEAIRRQPHGYTRIRDQFKQNKSTFKIDPGKVYRYVEIGSVNVSTGDITPKELLGAELPANAKRVLKKGDIIVSKVRTYRGAITIVPEDGYVGSGAFCILQENGTVNKETLFSYLRSELFLTWSLKPSAGTTYPTLNDNDILDFPMPLPPFNVQENVAHEVMNRKSEAIRLKQEAEAILEEAKGQVERILLQEG